MATYTSTVNGGTGVTYTYTYDQNGNITKIVYSTGEEIRYEYDDLGQLTREDNGLLNKTYVYTYDNAGNIISKKTYALTAAGTTPSSPTSTYSYGYSSGTWGDMLTSYRGTTITYDAIGNPLSYYNGSSYTFAWNGRQLKSATKGGVTYTFKYNDEGIRTSKTKNGVTTTYYLNGSQIIGEETNGNITVYLYDVSGLPVGLQYHGATYSATTWDVYWFEKNLHGDIIAVYNSTGTKIVSYTYDAWGNCTATSTTNTVVANNPFRYRGYYYDADLGLYYLNSRYYDANVGRFVNADSIGYLGANGDLNSYNLYAYCSNNPVMGYDPMGTWDWGSLKKFGQNCLKAAVVVIGVAIAVGSIGAAIGGTIASGGAGAVAIPAAVAVATKALAISSVAVAVIGSASIAVAEQGNAVSYLVGEN